MKLLDVLLRRTDDKNEITSLKAELESHLKALHEGAIISETDPSGNITFVNEPFIKLSGYSEQEIIGKNHRVLKSGSQSEEVYKKLWKTISSGKVWRGTLCNRNKNGELYWVKSTIVPIFDEKEKINKYLCIMFDVSEEFLLHQEVSQKIEEITAQEEEMRQMNEEMSVINENLAASQRELETQLYAMNNAVLVSATDIRGNIVYANDKFCQVAGYTREEFMGKNHRIIRHPDMPAEIFDDLWKTISGGKIWQGVVKNIRKDNSHYWVHATVTPILNERGVPVKYFSVRSDITAQKELADTLNNSEQKIDQLNAHLSLAKTALEKKVESIEGEFK
ncbi:MAG: PAS domain-containing protein, partial [Bacteroidia bacterium]|nr:PAS domain-containing protein [Bacteroidia bacterium]